MIGKLQRRDSVLKLFRYIFYAFFQPARLTRELQSLSLRQRLVLMLKLIIPMFLVIYPFTLASETILFFSDFLNYSDIARFLLLSALIIGVGIGIGTALGITFNIAAGTALGIAFGIAESINISITAGIKEGIVASSTGGIVIAMVGGLLSGIAWMSAVKGSSRGAIAGTGAIAVGVALSSVGGSIGGSAGFLAGVSAMLIGWTLGLLRVPLYLVNGISALYVHFVSNKRPGATLKFLGDSSLHWDEFVLLPLPFLKQTLLKAYDEDPQGALAEIAFIATRRPTQLQAARAATLEITLHALENCTTIEQIAEADQRINEILLPETKLSDPRWSNTLPRLSEASREAMRSLQPIGYQAQLASLDQLSENLNKISSNAAFGDQHLNARLRQVITTWLAIARVEHARIASVAQNIGSINNPAQDIDSIDNPYELE